MIRNSLTALGAIVAAFIAREVGLCVWAHRANRRDGTAHLLRHPANAKRLLRSIEALGR